MSLTPYQIERLKNRHGTELSALNALIQLLSNNGLEEDSPLYTTEVIGQSTILNVIAGQTGNVSAYSKPTLIMNTGSTDILINGEVISAGLSFPFEGAFTYDSQLSSILIITTD